MSVLGHVAVGVVASLARSAMDSRRRFLALVGCTTLAALPDVDWIVENLGLVRPSESPLAHRGLTHSIVFVIVVAAVAALIRRWGWRRHAIATGVLVAGLVGSHLVLDLLSTGPQGLELWWPFSSDRVLSPWQFLPSPSVEALLRGAGLAELATELVVFLPVWLVGGWLWSRRIRPVRPADRRRRSARSVDRTIGR